MRVRLCLLTTLCWIMSGCSTSTPNADNVNSAILYLTLGGNPGSIQTYTATLNNAALNQFGPTLATGNVPFSMSLAPSLNALFVSNNNSGNITSFTIGSSGALGTGSTTSVKTGAASPMPMGMAIDHAGKFLFVANQGANSISVFAISGTTLTPVAGSPFCNTPSSVSPTCAPIGSQVSTFPTALVVSATGNFLYVANNFANSVTAFSINSSGALSLLGVAPYAVGLAPSGIGIVPAGGFLYVANTGSNTVSAFAICDKVVTSCANPNTPDGTLTPVPGSPFSTGLGPISIAADPFFNFLYVLNKQSFQISEFSYAAGTGILAPLSTPAVTTGTTPLSFVIIAGAVGSNTGNTLTEPTDYVFVANNGDSSVTEFTLNTTTGLLTPLGAATLISGNPSAVAAN
jgi:6-phosphogluconolactonase